MTQPHHSPDIEPVYQLLTSYSFDVEAYPMAAIIDGWLDECGPVWVSHAITEALYQGRYKVVSIDHILKLWQRRGQPIRHFNREFESIILGQTLLCPTGYGDGSETHPPTKAAAPMVTQVEPSPLTPSLESASEESASAPSPEQASPVVNPFDAEGSLPSDTATLSGVVPNFRPLLPDLGAWPQAEEIRPFVPRQDSSELHQRLQAVVKGSIRK